MTFRVNFYADQAFFSMVKRILENGQQYNKEQRMDFEPEESATAILICHSACEAFLNIFANDIPMIDFKEYEKKSIIDKIEILYCNNNKKANWSIQPLQDIKNLNKVRNWLTHFKNSDIGLINSMGQWVIDEFNKRPRIDDGKELNFKKVGKYYLNVRKALFHIAKLYDKESSFDYLKTENFNSYLIG